MLHPGLQDQHRSHLIDHLPAPLDRHLGFPQQAVCFRRGQPLIPKVHRQLQTLPQFLGEDLHLLRLDSFLPAHTQRKADHDFSHFIVVRELRQFLEIQALVLALECFKALCGDSQGIGNGDADALRPNVESQDALCRNGRGLAGRCAHAAIICCAGICEFRLR